MKQERDHPHSCDKHTLCLSQDHAKGVLSFWHQFTRSASAVALTQTSICAPIRRRRPTRGFERRPVRYVFSHVEPYTTSNAQICARRKHSVPQFLPIVWQPTPQPRLARSVVPARSMTLRAQICYVVCFVFLLRLQSTQPSPLPKICKRMR